MHIECDSSRWVPDTALCVIYLGEKVTLDCIAVCDKHCYIVSPTQYERLVALHGQIAMIHAYMMEGRNSSVRAYFHPACVTMYIDEVVGFQSILLTDGENVFDLRNKGASLISLHIVRRIT